MNLLAIFIGGGVGSLLRYAISKLSISAFGAQLFPIGTFISNVLASGLLAFLIVYSSNKVETQPVLRGLLLIGFCGGFSTFSTFSIETVQLIKTGNVAIAIANILVNVLVCVGLIYFMMKKNAI